MKMSRKYSVLLFDLDGTLTDPGEGIRNSVSYALQKYGINVTEQELLNRFIGPPLQEGFQEFYGFSSKEAIRAVGFYREYYGEKGIFQNKLYDGIPGMLKKLQANGIALLVATSKPEPYAREIIRHFHLESFFLYIAGGNMDGTRCKKQEVISYALKTCHFDEKKGIAMVGDRRHDIEGAKLCGIDSIGVLYGYGSEKELMDAGAGQIAGSPEELLSICLSYKLGGLKQ